MMLFAAHQIVNPRLHAIYGLDDRELVSNKTSKKLKEMAKSVALIVHQDELIENNFKMSYKLKAHTQSAQLNICASEKFSTNMSISACTGFLVAKDLLVTAGHCFQSQSDCNDKKIVFDVLGSNQKDYGYKVLSKNIFSCKEIIVSKFGGEEDFAIIRLDKMVTNTIPLKMNLTKKIKDNQMVFMVGHPLGQPLTISKKTRVSENIFPYIFKAPLDSFLGNSGSPIFNSETLEVEGILVRGEEDLLLDEENKCYLHKKYDESGIGNPRGEGIFRISELSSFIN